MDLETFKKQDQQSCVTENKREGEEKTGAQLCERRSWEAGTLGRGVWWEMVSPSPLVGGIMSKCVTNSWLHRSPFPLNCSCFHTFYSSLPKWELSEVCVHGLFTSASSACMLGSSISITGKTSHPDRSWSCPCSSWAVSCIFQLQSSMCSVSPLVFQATCLSIFLFLSLRGPSQHSLPQ